MGACQSKTTTTTLHHPPKDTIPQTKTASSSSLQQQPSSPQQQQSLKFNNNNKHGAATTEASSASASSSSRGAASRASRNAMTKASSSSTTATADSSPEPESAPTTTSTSVVSVSSASSKGAAENNKAHGDIASNNTEESTENVASAGQENEPLASPRGSVRTSSSSSPRRRSARVCVILPSTLSGPPIAALVPPGVCQISDEAVALPLLQKFPVTANSAVLRFGLPDPSQPLNLTTCACLLAQAELEVDVVDEDKDEEERKSTTKKTTAKELVTRPYTPISTNEDVGYFDVLIKDYGKYGKLSRHLHSLTTGDTVLFKHIPFNVKLGAKDFLDCSEILMLAGGTGITPMLQALHAILGQTSKRGFPKVMLLYGSRTSKDILGRQLLDQWSAQYPNQLKVHHVLSQEPMTMSAWDSMGQFFLRGRIDRELIEHSFGPCRDCVSNNKAQANKLPPPQQRVLVCGPPALYQALCGPRDEPQKVRGALAELGYTPRHVYKF